MNNWFLLLFVLPTIVNAALNWQSEAPPPFSIIIKIDEEKIMRDAFISFEALITYPSSYTFDAETLVDQLTWNANPLAPELSIEKREISLLPPKDAINSERVTLLIAPLITGAIEFSLLDVTFTSKEKEHPPVKILTPIFTIEVLPLPTSSYLQEATDLPLAPLAPLAFQFPMDLTLANRELLIDGPERLRLEMERNKELLDRRTFPWITLMILIGIGGIGWGVYLVRGSFFKYPLKSVPPLDPLQKANRALQELQHSKLLEQSQFSHYYATLTSIALSGLEKVVGKPTAGLTTKEIEQLIEETADMPSPEKERFLKFLKDADQIKFAGQHPSMASAQDDYSVVHIFIQSCFREKKTI